MISKVGVIVIVTIVSVTLSTCSQQDGSSLLRLALQTEPTTLDPAHSVDFSSGMISSLIHSNLVRFNPEGRIVSDLAGRWEISENGTMYTFHLLPAVFSNGRKVTASDVTYSFRRLLDPATVSPRWWVLKDLRGAERFHSGGIWDERAVGTLDDSTVVLHLREPAAHFLSLLAMPPAGIVCRKEISRQGKEYGRFPCGSGPWKLDLWSEGDELLLTRNPFYRGKQPAIEGISYRIIPESMTRIAEFEVGNLDILEVPRAELERWRSAGAPLSQREELRVVYIGLNNARSPFHDPVVRRALNLAVDVEAIIAHVLFGAGRRARGIVPPGLRGTPVPDDLYPYDPDEARELLAKAGYPEGFKMEIWQRENPEGGRILESVQGYLVRVGIHVDIVTREWGAFKQAVDQGTPDAFYLDWFADYPDAENFLVPLFHSSNRGGGGNRAGYESEVVDSLLEAGTFCRDESKRWEFFRAAEERIYRDAPWIFLWFPIRYEVVSHRLQGYRIPLIFNGQRFLDVTF